MPLDHRHAFHNQLAAPAIHRNHPARFAFVAAGNHFHLVVLFNPGFMECLFHRPFRHQITSGASETIFINRLSRSSRATGPNTRVPTGSPTSLISTAALETKRRWGSSL